MALSITKAHAQQAMHKYEALKNRLTSVKKKAEETTQRVVRSTTIGASAFAMGLVQGRTGGIEVVGVPLELGLGVGLNILSIMGGAGQYSEHLGNAGDGCLAAYATTLGRGVGTTMREKAQKGDAPATQSALSGSGSQGTIAARGSHLTPEEIAEMVSIPA